MFWCTINVIAFRFILTSSNKITFSHQNTWYLIKFCCQQSSTLSFHINYIIPGSFHQLSENRLYVDDPYSIVSSLYLFQYIYLKAYTIAFWTFAPTSSIIKFNIKFKYNIFKREHISIILLGLLIDCYPSPLANETRQLKDLLHYLLHHLYFISCYEKISFL